MLSSRNVDERRLGNFRELPETDAVAKQDPGDWSKDDEERVKNLFFDLVLHARRIYSCQRLLAIENPKMGKIAQVSTQLAFDSHMCI